jgi:hypothetical protein
MLSEKLMGVDSTSGTGLHFDRLTWLLCSVPDNKPVKRSVEPPARCQS